MFPFCSAVDFAEPFVATSCGDNLFEEGQSILHTQYRESSLVGLQFESNMSFDKRFGNVLDPKIGK